MKRTSSVLIALALMLLSSPGFAAVDFFIDAELPSSNSASFNVSKVFVGPPLNFIPTPTFNLDFGVLSLDDVNGIFVTNPAFYWVIDVGSNGAGMPDVGVSYANTATPPTATHNLGAHATVNFAEIVTNPGTPPTQTTNDITTVALNNVGSLPGGGINETQFSDGFLRISVGIYTGPAPITGASPFTALDAPGVYSGTLTLTATFD